MYQFSYSEVIADDPADARNHERVAFDHAIALLRAAEGAAPQGPEEQEALSFVTQMWGLFIKDLAHPGNDLPRELKAQLMSVGLWVMGAAQRIQLDGSRDLLAIADICDAVRQGLAER